LVTSIHDCSRRLNINYYSLRLWVLAAGLPVGRIGTAYVVNFDEVAKLVAEKRQKRAG
jgi:hypothetical protein